MTLPIIAAPMYGVSDLAIVKAACAAGIGAAFPTANCASPGQLEDWIADLNAAKLRGPVCPNVIVHRSFGRLDKDLAVLAASPPEIIITSVGNPRPVIDAMSGTRTLVFADVATVHHASRAIEAGADGLILLTAGAGGQTGWLNPIAFCRAVRRMFSGPVAVAGSIADGASIRAAIELGADLAYCGTVFIATQECSAPEAYKQMIIASTSDDVVMTRALTGLPVNVLKGWAEAVGLDVDLRQTTVDLRLGSVPAYSAGHGAALIESTPTIAAVVDRLRREFSEPSERLAKWATRLS